MKAAVVALVAAISLSPAASAGSSGAPHWKAWLCFPGTATDWCSVDLTTDIFTANGTHTTVPVSVPASPAIDCFYVYPTVSQERRGNADLRLQPEERETAITQAARFSHFCRVYAPLYHQKTDFARQYNGSSDIAYASVVA